MARKETLCQRADNEDEEALELTEAEFYEKLKDPKTLYQEIVELIQQARDLRAFSKNYRKQLVEAKQALQRSETAGGMPVLSELIQLKNKLQNNADAYPTKDLQIIYAAGYVSGDALALILPCLSATNCHAYETIDELYEYLYELYGDPNKERNTHQAFRDLAIKKG
ncbi:hypothetical protein GP486_006764 [Trichoglossum hirsutum]|uniref:Uncharacterized protein n=1 Tax=Trichoglossum hirsutum TaxID=265104 RepID=A0A9P8ICZ9_9PEZI|nr:hypothetical protein GP486_006764 [Trichoglossum hirsutum]